MRWARIKLPLLAGIILVGGHARADDPGSENPIGPIGWDGVTFVPQNLGPLKLEEKTFAKITQYPRGLAFLADGDLLATLGSGTTPLMEIMKWTGTTPSTFVHFHWHDYTAADFKNPDKMKGQPEEETHGIFWFFGGPLAVDGKDQIYFNLGACGPNGLYQLLQIDPIKVRMLFSSAGFQTLQFFPSGSQDLYATSSSTIDKIKLGESNPAGASAPVFSVLGGHSRLRQTLFIDEDHLLATVILIQPATEKRPQEKRPPPKFMAVEFDRKSQGYHVLDTKNWGPMAIRPTDHALFRFDADAKEIRQFTLPSSLGDDKAPSAAVNPSDNSAPTASGANLTAEQILYKSKAAYAALTTYTDEGTILALLNGLTMTTTFKIKLARPNLYRIDWTQTNDSPSATTITKPQSVWSAGDGDFLDAFSQGPKKQANQETALSSATGISGGAAATIPGAFLKTQYANYLSSPAQFNQQLPDEKVGDTACYVLAGTSKGTTSTLWIGKQDFLIHQFRRTTTAAAMKSAMDEAAKVNPTLAAHMPAMTLSDLTSTETHTHIVLNPKLAPSDFTH